MNDRELSPCDGLLEYLTGEGSEIHRKKFERHLESCSSCKEEATTWHEVLGRLEEDVKLVDPPADLKEAVLRPLFQELESEANPIQYKARPNGVARKFIGVAVLLIVFMAGWLLRDIQIISIQGETASASPSKIEALYHLAADKDSGRFNESPRAYGVACLVRSEGNEQLVVYIFGSPPTQNGEAYQVWLLNKGQRSSAGTFTVGTSGIGIMTLATTDGVPEFESVGVTLEKNEFSSTPKGPRMFISEDQT